MTIWYILVQEYSNLKRKLEAELLSAQADLDEAGNALRHSDEKSKKAIVDAMRLADELRLQFEQYPMRPKSVFVVVDIMSVYIIPAQSWHEADQIWIFVLCRELCTPNIIRIGWAAPVPHSRLQPL
jgi:hypothetical protein